MLRRAAALLALLGLAASVQLTASAFAAQASNAGNAFTATSGCTAGTQTVTATADTTVMQNNATVNYGSTTTTTVKSRSNQAARTLVTFNLPPRPGFCTVTAVLQLTATAAAVGQNLQVYRGAATWSESTATWANQPATAGTAVSMPAMLGTVQWTVTDHVKALYAGTNTGFVIRDANEATGGGGATQTFNSREASVNRPVLVLTFS